MSVLLLIFALMGWIFAFIFFILLLFTSLMFGAAQELAKEQGAVKIDSNRKTKTRLWSLATEKEIPFGD